MSAIEIKVGCAYEGPDSGGGKSRVQVIGQLPLGLVAVMDEFFGVTAENPQQLAAWAECELSPELTVLLFGEVEPDDATASTNPKLERLEMFEELRSAAAVGDLSDLVRASEVKGLGQLGGEVGLTEDDAPHVALEGVLHGDAMPGTLGRAVAAQALSFVPRHRVDEPPTLAANLPGLPLSGRSCSLTAHRFSLGDEKENIPVGFSQRTTGWGGGGNGHNDWPFNGDGATA